MPCAVTARSIFALVLRALARRAPQVKFEARVGIVVEPHGQHVEPRRRPRDRRRRRGESLAPAPRQSGSAHYRPRLRSGCRHRRGVDCCCVSRNGWPAGGAVGRRVATPTVIPLTAPLDTPDAAAAVADLGLSIDPRAACALAVARRSDLHVLARCRFASTLPRSSRSPRPRARGLVNCRRASRALRSGR